MDRLSLATALASDRLEDFIAQAEADGVGRADWQRFNGLVVEASKERPPEGQTSRSPVRGSKRGK